jgi:hypothetical protein
MVVASAQPTNQLQLVNHLSYLWSWESLHFVSGQITFLKVKERDWVTENVVYQENQIAILLE